MKSYSEKFLASQHWDLGGLSMRPLVEMIEPFGRVEEMLPGFDAAAFEPHRSWMTPDYYCAQSDKLVFSIHGWLVTTRRHRVLIDTCVGCDKSDNWRHSWHRRQDRSWLKRLNQAGVAPAQIDYVFCTHMHLDHCGWHTELVDGGWRPTFANARYLFSRIEYENARDNPDCVFEENVAPIVASGQADIVESDHVVDEQIRLMPLPGHTAGHVAVGLRGEFGEAVMWGDLIHSPLQIREPGWPSTYDDDARLGCETRSRFLRQYQDTPVLILTSHFPPPSAGYLREGRFVAGN